MTKNDIIDIYSLSEYMSVIKNLNFEECYFRGEKKQYPSINSSLLRKDKSLLLEGDIPNSYEKLVNYYYNDIAANIGEIERKNFMAFSQHHGLYTNLIDFTTSPLIALFFSCYATNNIKSDFGQVHIIKKEDTIDMSNIITDYIRPPDENYNIIDKVFGNDKLLKVIQKHLIEHFSRNPHILNTYINNIFLECCALQDTLFDNVMEFTIKYSKLRSNIDNSNYCKKLSKLVEHESRYLAKSYCNDSIKLYICLLFDYFMPLRGFVIGFDEHPFPSMPYFLYKTPYKFDRIRNQEGLFLYQLYYFYGSQGNRKIMIQRIVPNVTIIIHNQQHIFNDLDMVGINQKFIFSDYDNIADYINKKFSRNYY